MMIRLYFNKRGFMPWSLDHGPGTEEHNYSKVYLKDISGRTGVDLYSMVQANEDVPIAWLEFEGAEIIAGIEPDSVIIRKKQM